MTHAALRMLLARYPRPGAGRNSFPLRGGPARPQK
jgi:hypothetical protein